ncbi:MAG: hypothetical protein AB7G47_16395 [Mycolicibacterium sp.]|uniref:hypothetical protein n=1 Tax=Mycolicibacterium sp. TaxID=2320850 RepID=UPI003D0F45F4
MSALSSIRALDVASKRRGYDGVFADHTEDIVAEDLLPGRSETRRAQPNTSGVLRDSDLGV